MANTIEPTESAKIQREKDAWVAKNAQPENAKQIDQINYDLAPLEGPVIYLTHKVSN
ncbi:hypothetical protein J2X72_003832 [Phyllobacterium sp. 1468]|uniref:hypothetical protein n=1 Tax=Phyllobacterium sp. 1468 TaxID=2817759 RepID=UPI001AE388AF|nr:hypothetical protein [Phyllobacterium sp. 1468]MDR6635020.1 hypothetical protein [Phyllobacterium sp. 1468]